MPLSWEDSGRGNLRITLQDVQELAIESGFVFANTHTGLPLGRRANLSALFETYRVNSLSSFVKLFNATPLLPPWEAAAPKKTKEPLALKGPEPATTWAVQETAGELFIGQLCTKGERHGNGLLLTRGNPDVLYVGSFQHGKRHGFGEVLTSRGEAYQGPFEDGIMWGPGCYAFPRAAGQEGAPGPRAMAKFEGMFNGRPAGKGVLFWEDGEEEAGEYEGSTRVRALEEEECAAVLFLSQHNAKQSREQTEAIKRELVAQQLWGRACSSLGEQGCLVQGLLGDYTNEL